MRERIKLKTQQQIIEAVKSGEVGGSFDGRDLSRLSNFFPVSDWEIFGFGLKEGAKVPTPKPWTEENVLKQLAIDTAFGFEKALNQRGISASCMNDVVKMWMWVLEDELQDHDEYAQYGLPLLKLVAVKYGFDNPIGDDTGGEAKYSCYGE